VLGAGEEAPVGAMVGPPSACSRCCLRSRSGLRQPAVRCPATVLLDEATRSDDLFACELLSEPHRKVVRQLSANTLTFAWKASHWNRSSKHRPVEEIHNKLWARAAAVGEKNPGSIVVGLFIQSLNEVIDLHSARCAPLPRTVSRIRHHATDARPSWIGAAITRPDRSSIAGRSWTVVHAGTQMRDRLRTSEGRSPRSATG